MSQASELLENLAAEASNGAEIPVDGNIIVGADRFLTVPESLKKLGVQFDHAVNTVTFDCPRFWDGRDLATMKIYVNYMRPDGTLGMSLCENLVLDGEDSSIIHFDWIIFGHVTEISGNISFLVCAKKVDKVTGVEENHWNSELCSEVYVSAGLKCKETVLKRHPDIITQLLLRMENAENGLEEWKKNTQNSLTGHVNSIEKTAVDAKNEAVDAKNAAKNSASESKKYAENAANEAGKIDSAVADLEESRTVIEASRANIEEFSDETLEYALTEICNTIFSDHEGAYHGAFECEEGKFTYSANRLGNICGGLIVKVGEKVAYAFNFEDELQLMRVDFDVIRDNLGLDCAKNEEFATDGATLSKAIGTVCDGYMNGENMSYNGVLTCAEGTFTFNIFRSNWGWSGVVTKVDENLTYSFYRSEGADAVLKKWDGETKVKKIAVESMDRDGYYEANVNLADLYENYQSLTVDNIIVQIVKAVQFGGEVVVPPTLNYNSTSGILNISLTSSGMSWSATSSNNKVDIYIVEGGEIIEI